MTSPKKGTWYYCPTCFNYSKKPMECCGEMMIKDELEEEIEDQEEDIPSINVEY